MPFNSTYSNNIVQSETVTRITSMVVGNIPTFDINGKLIDSGIVASNNTVNFTEAYTLLTTPVIINTWTVTTVTGAPANRVIEILMLVDANASRTFGVRAVGSILNRFCGVVGDMDSISLLVKTNALSQIELNVNVLANSKFYYVGTFN